MESVFDDITETVKSDNYAFFHTLAGKLKSTIERKSTLSILDENNEPVDILKEEIIKIYPLDKHSMYEAVITFSKKQKKQTEIVDSFYFLVLVTPDNDMFNCDFFDITQISGNPIEDDNYEKVVLNQAQKLITKEEDLKALKFFIKMIRQKILSN